MIITLMPRGQSVYEANPLPALHLERQGDTLIINGDSLDLSVLEPGDEVVGAMDATDCPFLSGDIVRDVHGVLHVSLVLPHAQGDAAPVEARFPQPIHNPPDGVVPLPETRWPPPVQEPIEPEQEDEAEA